MSRDSTLAGPRGSTRLDGPSDRPAHGLGPSKIHSRHLDRSAIVYVRQSSPQQVHEHRESTARQYALVDHAVALGWPADRAPAFAGRRTPPAVAPQLQPGHRPGRPAQPPPVGAAQRWQLPLGPGRHSADGEPPLVTHDQPAGCGGRAHQHPDLPTRPGDLRARVVEIQDLASRPALQRGPLSAVLGHAAAVTVSTALDAQVDTSSGGCTFVCSVGGRPSARQCRGRQRRADDADSNPGGKAEVQPAAGGEQRIDSRHTGIPSGARSRRVEARRSAIVRPAHQVCLSGRV